MSGEWSMCRFLMTESMRPMWHAAISDLIGLSGSVLVEHDKQ